ncbi:hypothetical protein ACHAXM_004942 [Skeletonema potamos]|jgi:hypothetical protein
MMTRATTNDGNELIVEFSERRRSSSYAGNEKTSPTTITKQVRFSKDVSIIIFTYPSRDEVSQRWHSKRDKALFTQELVRDIRSIRMLLSITPMEELEKETLYGCIGLEALVSGKVTAFVKEKKREHSRKIVEMQYFLSDDQLAAYAESRSLQTRERAQKLAAGYLAILS